MFNKTIYKERYIMSIRKELFDKSDEYGVIHAYTMTNRNGISVRLLEFGGIMNKLLLPDKNGEFKDVVCGFDNLDGYLNGGGYHGALIGRYGNRIANGRFTLNGKEYVLNLNEDGVCHLHGGNVGFNLKVWEAEVFEGDGYDRVSFSAFSPDGEEGYPGNLTAKVTYTLSADNSLTLHYEAVSDKDTLYNPTNHAYFNLNGYDGDSVMDQILWIDADTYDEVDNLLVPVGSPKPVRGTPFDFTTPKKIGQTFDHNFNLHCDGTVKKAAELYDPASGRVLTVYTDMPAVQLYTAGGMNNKMPFKGGVPQRLYHACCLETQYAPNTPNRPDMPSCVLPADVRFDKTTKFVFSVKNN